METDRDTRKEKTRKSVGRSWQRIFSTTWNRGRTNHYPGQEVLHGPPGRAENVSLRLRKPVLVLIGVLILTLPLLPLFFIVSLVESISPQYEEAGGEEDLCIEGQVKRGPRQDP